MDHRDIAVIDVIMHPYVQCLTRGVVIRGRKSVRSHIDRYLDEIQPMQTTVEHLLVQENLVSAWWRAETGDPKD